MVCGLSVHDYVGAGFVMRVGSDLVTGDVCVLQHWCHEHIRVFEWFLWFSSSVCGD